jgi:hypothetical protein
LRISGLPATPAENESIILAAKALLDNVKVYDEWLERLSGRGGLAGLRADLPIERYPRLLLFGRWVAAWLESSGQHWAAGTLFRSDAACISSLSDQTTAALVADVYP